MLWRLQLELSQDICVMLWLSIAMRKVENRLLLWCPKKVIDLREVCFRGCHVRLILCVHQDHIKTDMQGNLGPLDDFLSATTTRNNSNISLETADLVATSPGSSSHTEVRSSSNVKLINFSLETLFIVLVIGDATYYTIQHFVVAVCCNRNR